MDSNYKSTKALLDKTIEMWEKEDFSTPKLNGIGGKVYTQIVNNDSGKKFLRLEEVYSSHSKTYAGGCKVMYIRGYVEVEVTEDTEDVLVELRQAVARPVIASIELNNDEYPKPARSLATLIERAESCLKVTFLDVIDKTLTIYKEAVYAN